MADYIVHKAVELSALSKKLREDTTKRAWVISPKYDGCHVIFLIDNNKFIGAFSRTGEQVLSMDHIGQDLASLVQWGQIAVCGEAWMYGKEFNEISGMFRRQYAQPQLGFAPFDYISFVYTEDSFLLGEGSMRNWLYRERLGLLADLLADHTDGVIFQPSFWMVTWTTAEVVSKADYYAKMLKARTDSFFDGAVVARADGLYRVGAGKGGEFIKVKPLLSYSVKVGAVIADFGSKTGKNTCVLCFDLDGHVQKVSTGLTQEQANQFTENPNLILDKTIEVEAMGKTVNGYLREPRFKGIRDDA